MPSITKLLADYMNTHDVFRNFINEHLEACNINEEVVDPDSAEQPVYVKVDFFSFRGISCKAIKLLTCVNKYHLNFTQICQRFPRGFLLFSHVFLFLFHLCLLCIHSYISRFLCINTCI